MNVYPKTFIALDLETTGLDPEKGSIVEVAALRYRGGKEVERFTTLVNPKRKIPFIVTDITGITDEDVKNMPTIDQVMPDLIAFIGDTPIVGHNIAFDLAFLRASGFTNTCALFDTWKIATFVYRSFASYSLENVANRLGISVEDCHRAYDDARVSAELFYHLADEITTRFTKTDLMKVAQFVRGRSWDLEDVFLTLMESAGAERKIDDHIPLLKQHEVENPLDLLKKDLIERHGKERHENRDHQIRLSEMIAHNLTTDSHKIIEISPGTGRILGTLTGIAEAVHQGIGPVLVAFRRQTLSSDHFTEDLALVNGAVKEKIQVTKSPGSYLCERSFSVFLGRQDLSTVEIDLGVKILLWLTATKTGDLDELALVREQRFILPQLAGQECLISHAECFATRAWEAMRSADVVLTDHATLIRWFARDNDFAKMRHLVIDSAEDLEDAATGILSQTFSQNVILEYLEQISRPQPGMGFLQRVKNSLPPSETKMVEKLEVAVQEVSDAAVLFFGLVGIALRKKGTQFGENRYALKLLIDDQLWNEEEGKKVAGSLNKFIVQILGLKKGLENMNTIFVQQSSFESLQTENNLLIRRLESTVEGMQEVFLKQENRWVNWVVLLPDKNFYFKKSPLELSTFFEGVFWKDRTVLLLSQNFTHEGSVGYMQTRLGITDFHLERIYPQGLENRSILLLVRDLPSINSPLYLSQASALVLDILATRKTQTVLVTSSLLNCRTLYERMKPVLMEAGYDVFAQGISGGRNKILEQLLATEHSVLIVTPGFLDSLPFPSSRMELLVMLKLPFEPPSDPLRMARERSYRNPFYEFTLPRAVLRFRAVVQRMYKHPEQPRACLVLDSRMANSDYKEIFIHSLPEIHTRELTAGEARPEVISWLNISVDKDVDDSEK